MVWEMAASHQCSTHRRLVEARCEIQRVHFSPILFLIAMEVPPKLAQRLLICCYISGIALYASGVNIAFHLNFRELSECKEFLMHSVADDCSKIFQDSQRR